MKTPQDSNQKTSEISLRKFSQLVDHVWELLEPRRGCPWHLAQSPKSLAPYILEEAFELVECLEAHPVKAQSQNEKLCHELGDLLFQVLLQASHAEREGQFKLEQIFEGLQKKIVERHPHLFEKNAKALTQQQIESEWEPQKLSGKDFESFFGASEFFLPALLASFKIGKKSKAIDFDWSSSAEVLEKVEEEFLELKTELRHLRSFSDTDVPAEAESKAKATEKAEEELGDFLFSIAQLARHLNLNPETALRKANRKFLARLEACVGETSLADFEKVPREQKEELWKKVKEQSKT